MSLIAAKRLAREGLGKRLVEDAIVSLPSVDTYRLDPLSHLDAGHVKIRDLETRRPVVFRPYDHEVELIDAWVRVEGEGADARLVWGCAGVGRVGLPIGAALQLDAVRDGQRLLPAAAAALGRHDVSTPPLVDPRHRLRTRAVGTRLPGVQRGHPRAAGDPV